MAFQRDFNELLGEILTSYSNKFPGEVTAGSVLFVKAACSASMLWGLYQQLEKVADQMFVSTADRAHRELHAAEFGIVTADLTDSELTDMVLAAKRSKMAGGNRYDYEAWAREVTLDGEYITHAQVVPMAQGEGTFDIVVVGSPASEWEPSEALCEKIYQHIQANRPIGSGFSWGVRVVPASVQPVIIEIRGSGGNWNEAGTIVAIKDYVNSLPPGRGLQRTMISAIMHDYGADVAVVVRPTADFSPEAEPANRFYPVIRAGDVTVVP
jgi:uncharacterized phage protein gp47/JayE